jgi:hypothetical protein
MFRSNVYPFLNFIMNETIIRLFHRLESIIIIIIIIIIIMRIKMMKIKMIT